MDAAPDALGPFHNLAPLSLKASANLPVGVCGSVFDNWGRFVCFTLSASLLWRGTAEVHASFQQFSPHNLLDCARLRCAGNVSETFSADLPSIGLFQLRFDFFPVAVKLIQSDRMDWYGQEI